MLLFFLLGWQHIGKPSDERCFTWRFTTANTKEIPGSQFSGANFLKDVLPRCEGNRNAQNTTKASHVH